MGPEGGGGKLVHTDTKIHPVFQKWPIKLQVNSNVTMTHIRLSFPVTAHLPVFVWSWVLCGSKIGYGDKFGITSCMKGRAHLSGVPSEGLPPDHNTTMTSNKKQKPWVYIASVVK